MTTPLQRRWTRILSVLGVISGLVGALVALGVLPWARPSDVEADRRALIDHRADDATRFSELHDDMRELLRLHGEQDRHQGRHAR